MRLVLRRRDIDARRPSAVAGVAESPEAWFAYFEQLDGLIAELRACGVPEDLNIFFATFVQGLSNADAAARLGVPAAHDAARKYAIRRRVSDYLERYATEGVKS